MQLLFHQPHTATTTTSTSSSSTAGGVESGVKGKELSWDWEWEHGCLSVWDRVWAVDHAEVPG